VKLYAGVYAVPYSTLFAVGTVAVFIDTEGNVVVPGIFLVNI